MWANKKATETCFSQPTTLPMAAPRLPPCKCTKRRVELAVAFAGVPAAAAATEVANAVAPAASSLSPPVPPPPSLLMFLLLLILRLLHEEKSSFLFLFSFFALINNNSRNLQHICNIYDTTPMHFATNQNNETNKQISTARKLKIKTRARMLCAQATNNNLLKIYFNLFFFSLFKYFICVS